MSRIIAISCCTKNSKTSSNPLIVNTKNAVPTNKSFIFLNLAVDIIETMKSSADRPAINIDKNNVISSILHPIPLISNQLLAIKKFLSTNIRKNLIFKLYFTNFNILIIRTLFYKLYICRNHKLITGEIKMENISIENSLDRLYRDALYEHYKNKGYSHYQASLLIRDKRIF